MAGFGSRRGDWISARFADLMLAIPVIIVLLAIVAIVAIVGNSMSIAMVVLGVLVRRVDGIPLAIELAAARVRVLSAEEIAGGLDDHLRLLRGGHRSDPRHQTIRASLDWSQELLTGRERQLFARLSVFAGGFDLEAATAWCAGGAIVPGQILDEIQGLVEKSLLAVERRAGATRFRMLDFVRQYASERLAAAGEDVPLTDRHRVYFGK